MITVLSYKSDNNDSYSNLGMMNLKKDITKQMCEVCMHNSFENHTFYPDIANMMVSEIIIQVCLTF